MSGRGSSRLSLVEWGVTGTVLGISAAVGGREAEYERPVAKELPGSSHWNPGRGRWPWPMMAAFPGEQRR